MKILIGMECSGQLRRRFRAQGHTCVSVDLKAAEDAGEGHFQGDVFELINLGCWDLGIFHPTCTYLTASGEWAYADPDYAKYPGVGYHQKPKPGTLVGAERRQAREDAITFVKRLWNAPIPRVVIENPVGILSSVWAPPTQVVHPWWFGDDASKRTCLWMRGPGVKQLVQTNPVKPRLVNGLPRWGNQTDSGQNKTSDTKEQAADRSRTYDGFADAATQTWGRAA